MNLLFVCTGNTCRSPMGEGIARAVGRELGIEVVTLSTGLFCVPVQTNNKFISTSTIL